MSKQTRQEEFLSEYLANGGYKRKAAATVGIDYSNVKRWLQDEKFRARLTEAEDAFIEDLHESAIDRAKDKSDVLAIFFLKAMRPEVYDDNIRKAKWLAENGVADPDAVKPVKVMLIADELPERLRQVSVTNGAAEH